MAKRYFISPIIGDGTFGNSFRASVQDVAGVESIALIPTHTSGPDIGKPVYNFAFCRVGVVNLNSVMQVSNSYTFPDFPLDSQMSSMESEVRTGMVQSVEAYDLDGNGLHLVADHADTDSYRQVIAAIAQQIEPAFNINTFDVAEPVE